jgi:hypothetical protein
VTERVSDPSIDRVREHARRCVARTSLRKVARAAGVKVGATKKFIDGSVPYERNARMWKKWYARELREGMAETPDTALPTGDADAVLEVLLWSVPEEQRPSFRRELVDIFIRLHASRSLTPPAWALELAGASG